MSDLKPKPPESSSKKTFLVWFTMMMFFGVVYASFSGRPLPLRWDVFIGVSVALMVVYVFWVLYASKRANRSLLEGIACLGRGEHRKALALFEPYVGKRPKAVSLVARHNVAWTQLRMGQVRTALELFVANDRQMTLTHHMRTISAIDIAVCAALVGDTELARTWLAEAATRRKTGYYDREFDATIGLARAVTECRSGAPEEAVRLLEDEWTAFEQGARGEIVRPLRVVRAFAIATSNTRNAGMAEAALQLTKPAYPDEYTVLGAEWPEMKAFLAAHSLG